MNLTRFYQKAGYVFFFNGFAVGCGLIKNIILARHISEADLGLYSLLFTIVGFIYPLSLLGQQVALVRLLSGDNAQIYNLPRGLSCILGVSAVLIVLGAASAAKIYALDLLSILFLMFVAVAYAVTDLIPAVLRTQGRYALSIFIFRGVNFFLLAGLLILIGLHSISLKNVLWLCIVIYGIFAIATTAVARKHLGKGEKPLPASTWKDGFWVSGAAVSLLVIISIDQFLIPKILSFEALGLYFAIGAIMRVFELTLQAADFVLLPYASRLGKKQILMLSAGVVIIGLALVAGYLFAGPGIVTFLYQGEYDHGIHLIPYFCAVGFLRFIYVIPFNIISGKLSSQRLQQLMYANLASMALSIILGIIFIAQWGLVGATLNAIVIWSLRVISGFGIMYLEKRSASARQRYTLAVNPEEPLPLG